MKTYSVDVRWNHKGTKYPKDAHVRVKGTSLAIAANKAIKHVKKLNSKSLKEPVGASIRVDITIIDNGKEVEDVRRTDVAKDEQGGGAGVAEVRPEG